MSKPRYRWWGYVRNVIRAYPSLCEKYDDLKSQSMIAKYDAQPGCGVATRTVEALALRELIPQEQKEFEAVRNAIDATLRYDTGTERMELIKRAYFSGGQHRLTDVGAGLHIAEATAWRWHADFVRQVAGYLGLTN